MVIEREPEGCSKEGVQGAPLLPISSSVGSPTAVPCAFTVHHLSGAPYTMHSGLRVNQR